MKSLIGVCLLTIIIGLTACQQEPDLLPDQEEPEIQNLPKKIVEIDVRNDSAVLFLSYSASGDIVKKVVNSYRSGVMIYTDTATIYYYPDGKINWHVYRGRDMQTNGLVGLDQFFFKDASGKISGFRVADTDGNHDPAYYRYKYDNNRLQKVILEMDSADYFNDNIASYRNIDSMVYDANGMLTEEYSLTKNLITGIFSISGKLVVTGYEPGVFLPSGINNYGIFEDPFLLSTRWPSSYNYDNSLGTSGQFSTVTNYDTEDRPVKMTFTNTDGSGGGGLATYDVKQRLIYY